MMLGKITLGDDRDLVGAEDGGGLGQRLHVDGAQAGVDGAVHVGQGQRDIGEGQQDVGAEVAMSVSGRNEDEL